jgi:hypothetical protein
MKGLLISILLLFGLNDLFAQSYTYSYIDPCTGRVKSLSIPDGGNQITVNYYGTVSQFNSNDFDNGNFAAWINNIAAINSNKPCGEVVALLTTNVNMLVTQNIVSTVMNVTSIANMAQSISSMSSGMSGGLGSSVNNSENVGGQNGSKKYDKNEGNNNGTGSSTSPPVNNDNSGGQSSITGQGSQINSNNGNGLQSTGSNGSSSGNSSTTNDNRNVGGSSNGNGQTNSSGSEQGSGSVGNSSGSDNPTSSTSGSNVGQTNDGGSSSTGTTEPNSTGKTSSDGTSSSGTNSPNGQDNSTASKSSSGGSSGGSANGVSNSISNSEDNSGNGGNGNKGGSRARTGSMIGTGDIVALKSAEDPNAKNQFRFTASLTHANTKSTKVSGLLGNFTTGIKNTNLTLYKAWVIPKSQWTIIAANSSMLNFEKDFFNTTTTLASKRFKGGWKKLTVMGGLNYTMGNLGETKFGNLSAVGGGFYSYNIGKGKKISGSILCLAVYSPFTQFFEGQWWQSGILLVPFNSWDYSITKKFKFNMSISGVYQVNQSMLNYQLLTGGKVML